MTGKQKFPLSIYLPLSLSLTLTLSITSLRCKKKNNNNNNSINHRGSEVILLSDEAGNSISVWAKQRVPGPADWGCTCLSTPITCQTSASWPGVERQLVVRATWERQGNKGRDGKDGRKGREWENKNREEWKGEGGEREEEEREGEEKRGKDGRKAS